MGILVDWGLGTMVDWTWVYGGLDLGIWWSLGEAVDWRRVSACITVTSAGLCSSRGHGVGGGGEGVNRTLI